MTDAAELTDALPPAPPIPPGTRYYLAATDELLPPGVELSFPDRKLIHSALLFSACVDCHACPASSSGGAVHYVMLSARYALDNHGGMLFSEYEESYYIVRSQEPLPPLHPSLAAAFPGLWQRSWRSGLPAATGNYYGCTNHTNRECLAWRAAHPHGPEPFTEKHLKVAAEAANKTYGPIEKHLRALAQTGQSKEAARAQASLGALEARAEALEAENRELRSRLQGISSLASPP